MPQNQKKQEDTIYEDIPTRTNVKKVFKNELEKKRAEQKEYIPISPPKNTVEILVKPKPKREDIEKIEKVKEIPKKEKLGKKIRIEELTGDSILIITEKPQAAAKISTALSGGRARQIKSSPGVYYYEFQKNGKKIIIACAVGHLFSLSQNTKGSGYPIFDISWKPNFKVKKRDFTKGYYSNIDKLVKRAGEIIIATDYDTEGEVIGYNVARFIAQTNKAKRMKFSSLTTPELENAYNTLLPNINWGQAIAGETRHFLDWYYGINLSRALMNSIKSTGKFKIMSIGRVQGPALKMIVDKEKEILAFKSQSFWKIFIIIKDKKNNILELRYIEDIFDKNQLSKFENLKNKECQVETKKSEQILPPLPPFDLTTLQIEAYKFFSINPAKSLQIAQQLYLAGLISYPRTNSQKIPDSINPKQILKRLSEQFKETSLVSRNKPIEGKKEDPAHPSIYPTGEFQSLESDEKKIYELIVKRFIACFCSDAKIENKIITATIDTLKFKARGLEIKEKGWIEVYEVKMNEKELKDMNGSAIIQEVKIEEDETKPPRRYSPASIITELEKRSLGTKATRANIIETLFDRNYIAGEKAIQATSLGLNLIESLERYSPIIIDEKLTREIEEEMEKMQELKNKEELENKEKIVLSQSKIAIEKLSKDFHNNELKIGEELVKATKEAWEQEKKQNELNFQCPKCQKGKLAIKYSPKNRRHFVACNEYPNCNATFSLPPNGFIKQTDKICELCKFPMLMRLQKGKRPWIFCFNPECESRKQNRENNAEE